MILFMRSRFFEFVTVRALRMCTYMCVLLEGRWDGIIRKMITITIPVYWYTVQYTTVVWCGVHGGKIHLAVMLITVNMKCCNK